MEITFRNIQLVSPDGKGQSAESVTPERVFFLEDAENALMCVWPDEPSENIAIPFKVGDIIRVEAARGVTHFGMVFVTIKSLPKNIQVLGKVERISYITDSYLGLQADEPARTNRGRVHKWSGNPAAAGLYHTGNSGQLRGAFVGNSIENDDVVAEGTLGYALPTGVANELWVSMFADGQSRHFYGPTHLCYRLNAMQITHPGQIHNDNDDR
jgi:hypothetical protein